MAHQEQQQKTTSGFMILDLGSPSSATNSGILYEHLLSAHPTDMDVASPEGQTCEARNSVTPEKILEQKNDTLAIEHEDEGSAGAAIETVETNLEYEGKDLRNTDSNSRISSKSAWKEKKTPSKLGGKNYSLRSSLDGVRVLRPRSEGFCKTTPETSDNLVNARTKTRKKRKKRDQTKPKDEFLGTRKRVRYLLTRIDYEQSLIDAYSGEGWKGQSLEKIRPEKELQRAASEILRCKLKIRDLFQHLDSLSAEGRLQESLFDSDGQICSEEIFCAKCGSKDVSLENDIILCDGVCDRGFHQMCLDPPLLKEKIPPGDEGWLCPGCDCKVDCVGLVNDYQGTELIIEDSWEKVFAEAAAIAAGDNQYDDFGYPSDDSEDGDYNPDGPDLDENVKKEDSSSDKSDFTSDSSDSKASINDDGSSGSDSDEGSGSSSSENAEPVKPAGYYSKGTPEVPKQKKRVNSELLSILESEKGNSSVVSGKRHREELDYKKLHDDTYGNLSSDSSDDEDWVGDETLEKEEHVKRGTALQSKRRNQVIENGESSKTPARSRVQKKDTLPKQIVAKAEVDDGSLGKKDEHVKSGIALRSKRMNRVIENGEFSNTPPRSGVPKKDTLLKQNVVKAEACLEEEPENFLKENSSQKLEENACQTLKPCRESRHHDLMGSNTIKMKAGRFGEQASQRLHETFSINKYPPRDTKEKLAEELGITYRQVCKWFENARTSLSNSGKKEARRGISTPNGYSTPTKTSRMEPGSIETHIINNAVNAVVKVVTGETKDRDGIEEVIGDEGTPGNSAMRELRKRKVVYKLDGVSGEVLRSTEAASTRKGETANSPNTSFARRNRQKP